ncbi:MAG TPA: MarR family EPS-associated transcriptional regulator [Gammaproteobacteria bacterium]|nr:MarR family EPS-associated transcriptional regulator [Gammaproteobacteria bacterium]
MSEETTYKLLKLVKDNPHMSQRDIAENMGISLGKTNYCVKSLVKKGYIKAKNFYDNNNKKAYMYILTPRGIEEKARLTYSYLKIKMFEYEEIKKEINNLKLETARYEEQGK